jgi:hypothetical protein
MQDNQEQRNYFRIKDTVGISYSMIDDKIDLAGSELVPAAQVSAYDRELNQTINTLWLDSPITAKALGLLNRKLALINAQISKIAMPTRTSYEKQMVSISGSGIAFSCMERLAIGDRLRLTISLQPSHVELHITGEVVMCEPMGDSDEGEYWARFNFDSSNDAVQEQLVQHIVQRQCAEIQSSPLANPDEG